MQVLTLLPYEAMSWVFNPVCSCYDSWPVAMIPNWACSTWCALTRSAHPLVQSLDLGLKPNFNSENSRLTTTNKPNTGRPSRPRAHLCCGGDVARSRPRRGSWTPRCRTAWRWPSSTRAPRTPPPQARLHRMPRGHPVSRANPRG